MNKTKGIWIFLFSFLFLSSASIFQNAALYAQNLVPNPGFEEHHFDSVYFWQQPRPPFFHFEFNSRWAHSGKCLNALCDWGNQPTEYLLVKLTSPLTAQKKYKVSLYTMVKPEDLAEVTNNKDRFMGIYFQKNWINVYKKIYFVKKPNIDLYVYKDTLWHKTEFDYIAKGEENYMIMGHFFDSIEIPKQKIDTNYQNYLAQKEILIDKRNDVRKTEIAKIRKKYNHILSKFMEFGKMKNLRKRDRLLNEYMNASKDQKTEITNKLTEIYDKYNAKIDDLGDKFNIAMDMRRRLLKYRLCFDDISVSAEPEIAPLPEQIIPLNNVFFNTAEWILLPASFVELDKYVAYLKEKSNLKVEISGHTDNIGSDADNQLLSENRARAVVEYFVQNGISPERLTYKGYGSTKPIAGNQTDEGRAKNRRVEMKIISE